MMNNRAGKRLGSWGESVAEAGEGGRRFLHLLSFSFSKVTVEREREEKRSPDFFLERIQITFDRAELVELLTI